MADYFDPTAPADQKLLPVRLQDDENLADLVGVVQADIVARHTFTTFNGPAYVWTALPNGTWVLNDNGPLAGTVKLADNLYVGLRGYSPDATTAEATFKEAMRRELANALKWRLAQLRRSLGVTSASDGDKSEAFATYADDPLPPDFGRYLKPFVVTEPIWSF